jgi:hypothetical protein
LDLLEIVKVLETSAESDRNIDIAIAQLFKYKGAKAPYFTRSIDAAMMLAKTICPKDTCGVSWENGLASAKIGNGPYCQASTAPLALCLASLKAILALRKA